MFARGSLEKSFIHIIYAVKYLHMYIFLLRFLKIASLKIKLGYIQNRLMPQTDYFTYYIVLYKLVKI